MQLATIWEQVQRVQQELKQGSRETQVKCRFPNPAAVYNDTSASLLVCLKVIGDVLDMEIDPHTLVSGEVDQSGKVLPVACVAEKVLAAQKHPEIHRILLPANGLFMTSRRVEITGVHNLSEAVAYYYGEQFRKKMKQVSRRKVLKGALALAAVPFAPFVFSAFRNIFTHPVSEHDLQLLECARDLYTRNSDYHSATIILRVSADGTGSDVIGKAEECARSLPAARLRRSLPDRKEPSDREGRRGDPYLFPPGKTERGRLHRPGQPGNPFSR